MDTKSLINNYVWLIDLIRRRGKVSFKEIDKAWQRTGRDDGLELSKRTFLRHINDISEIFGIDIECEGYGEYRYFITNDDSESDSTKTWLLNSMSLHNFVCESQQLKKHILLENIPSGQKFLTTIIEAIRDQTVLHIWHQGFGKDESNFDIKPICVKLFRQRWYEFAKSQLGNRVYALDRINRVELTGKNYTLPKIEPEEVFENVVGVSALDAKIEKVRIKAFKDKEHGREDCYLRSLPLHKSQRELTDLSTDEYAVFEYDMKVSFELVQELLHHMDSIEVVAPKSLRNEMKRVIDAMSGRYKKRPKLK